MAAPQAVKPSELQQIAKPGIAESVRKPAIPAKTVDTIESLNPGSEAPSSWKLWLAKLPGCIGEFFAWLFGIKKEGSDPIQVPVPQLLTGEMQAKNIKECLEAFAKPDPDAAAIAKAKEAFGQLDVKDKLEVLQKLQANVNCTHAQLLPFFKLCPANPLYAHIEGQRPKEDVRKGVDILETNVKDPVVVSAVSLYFVEERDKADAERQKKILANFTGADFPSADMCKSSLDCFAAIEGDKIKLQTLQLLMGLDNLSDTHVRQFVAALPARPIAPVAKPAEGSSPAEVPVKPVLRDVLFDKLKAKFGANEEWEQNAYTKAAAAAERAKLPFNEAPPVKFNSLEDYFAARHKNLRIRQEIDLMLVAAINEV